MMEELTWLRTTASVTVRGDSAVSPEVRGRAMMRGGPLVGRVGTTRRASGVGRLATLLLAAGPVQGATFLVRVGGAAPQMEPKLPRGRIGRVATAPAVMLQFLATSAGTRLPTIARDAPRTVKAAAGTSMSRNCPTTCGPPISTVVPGANCGR